MKTLYNEQSRKITAHRPRLRVVLGLTIVAVMVMAILAPSALAARQDTAVQPALNGTALDQAQAAACNNNPANVLRNGGFETNASNWSFYSSGKGSLSIGSPAAECNNAAHVTLATIGNNMQLFQNGFALKANTRYRLSFSAYSSSGNDMRVYLQQHNKPYGSLGLNGPRFNLTNNWQEFSTEFTTSGFSGTTTNTRLRFWFVRYAANGDVYHLDNIVLEEVGGGSNPPPVASPSSTPPPGNPGGGSCTAVDSLLNNADFEGGTSAWSFYTNGNGSFDAGSPAYKCDRAAIVDLDRVGSNTQLYQNGFSLRAGARYRLSFAAYSTTGNDLRLYVQRHGSPYATFGLSGVTANLRNTWQTFSYEFTANGFSGTTSDTRLRFWFPGKAANGDTYYIDAVELQEIGGGSPPPAASSTPRPTATPAPGGGGGGSGKEMLIFDWNGPVTEANRGFPYDQPPKENGDWTKPVNYAEGTFHYRVIVRSQPVPQNMKIQFCFWQQKGNDRFALEACGPQKAIYGSSGTVATWSVDVEKMWKKGGKPIEWDRARYRNGAAIKNSSGEPVSNYNGWNWNGENPKHWYPLNMRYTVVVVAKGSTFSGWDNYK